MGEKPVAVTFDEMKVLGNGDNELRVYIDATKEKLEAQPDDQG